MIDFVKDTQYPCLGYGTMCVVLRQLQVWQRPGPGRYVAGGCCAGCLLGDHNMMMLYGRGWCR